MTTTTHSHTVWTDKGGHVSADVAVLQLNREAALRLNCPHQLVEVPGAGHLFEQPGSLENVARLACDWFLRFLPSAAPQPQPLRRGTAR